jgi:hypothetical protein
MRAFLVFTHSGPILVLTSCTQITEDSLLATFQGRGIDKFIAYEVPVESVHRVYGVPFEVVASDLERGQTMRVLDFNGPHILDTVRLSDLGAPIPYEH